MSQMNVCFHCKGIFYFSVFMLSVFCSGRFLRNNGLELEYDLLFSSGCYSDDTARLRQLAPTTLSTCVAECSLRGHCVLVQYTTRFHLCELFSSFNATQTIQKPGCVHVKRSNIVILKFPCSTECLGETVCDPGSKQCVLQECLQSPSVPRGSFLGNRKHIDSNIRLKCKFRTDEDYTSTATCQANGLWSAFTQTCPTFEESFYCPLSDVTYTKLTLNDGSTFHFRFVNEVALTHQQAHAYCATEGARLITKFPQEKRDFLHLVNQDCSNTYRHRYWIDGNNINATDFRDVTQWVMSTGELMTNDWWHPGEPSSPRTDHCAYLLMDAVTTESLICDWDCNDKYRFICEK